MIGVLEKNTSQIEGSIATASRYAAMTAHYQEKNEEVQLTIEHLEQESVWRRRELESLQNEFSRLKQLLLDFQMSTSSGQMPSSADTLMR